jgi:hypothetical protein
MISHFLPQPGSSLLLLLRGISTKAMARSPQPREKKHRREKAHHVNPPSGPPRPPRPLCPISIPILKTETPDSRNWLHPGAASPLWPGHRQKPPSASSIPPFPTLPCHNHKRSGPERRLTHFSRLPKEPRLKLWELAAHSPARRRHSFLITSLPPRHLFSVSRPYASVRNHVPSPSNPPRHRERLHLGTTDRAGPALIASRGFSGTDTLQLSCVTTIYSRSKLDHGMQCFNAFRSRSECLTGDMQRV